VSFSLPSAESASLEVFDVTGRRVDARAVGTAGAGLHHATFGADGRLSGGVYLVRLSQAGQTVTSRVVLIP
jgi:hypothetical protein